MKTPKIPKNTTNRVIGAAIGVGASLGTSKVLGSKVGAKGSAGIKALIGLFLPGFGKGKQADVFRTAGDIMLGAGVEGLAREFAPGIVNGIEGPGYEILTGSDDEGGDVLSGAGDILTGSDDEYSNDNPMM